MKNIYLHISSFSKSILFFSLLFFSINAKSQVFLNLGAGASFVEGPRTTGELNVGYNLDGFTFTTGFEAFINSGMPLIPQVRIGRVFNLNDQYSVESSIGYAYLFYSSDYSKDNPLNPNKSAFCFRGEIDRYINDQAKLYLSASMAGTIPTISIGIKTTF